MKTPPHNPVGWFEIYVSDLQRARRFYESVFATELVTMPLPDTNETCEAQPEMLFFPSPEHEATEGDCGSRAPGAPGALCQMEGVTPGGGGTLVYFSCQDCAEEESRVAAAGGKVIQPKMPIGQYGFISMIADSEGNMIGLHSLA